MVHLVDDWQRVIRRAWSIRLLIIAGALSGIEALLAILNGMAGIDTPWVIRLGLMALTPIVIMAAFVARLVAQQTIGARRGKSE